MRTFIQITAGMVVGIALVVTCGLFRLSPAVADTAATTSGSACAQWQIQVVKGYSVNTPPAEDMPAGWEPAGIGFPTNHPFVMLRRCKP
jgi:hypothetical protein